MTKGKDYVRAGIDCVELVGQTEDGLTLYRRRGPDRKYRYWSDEGGRPTKLSKKSAYNRLQRQTSRATL